MYIILGWHVIGQALLAALGGRDELQFLVLN